MVKKLIQKYFSITLILTLTFTAFLPPSQRVYANDTTSVSTVAVNTESSADAVKLAADKGAKTLTGLYGADSVSYALIDNGNIIQSDKFIKSNHTAESTSADIYGIGSISKLFTTTAVMQLVDQGKINLDTPVVTYIPEFTMADERYKDITVRMLLNHSSGLMGSTLTNALLFQDTDNRAHDNFLTNLKTQRLKAAPGAFSVYCNDGFTLAEILVEKVTGMTFSQYIESKIAAPLNLNKTTTPEDDLSKEALAGTYSSLYPSALPIESFHAIGAGGIYSSAVDLCNFAKLFMSSGNDQTVLSLAAAGATKYPEYSRGFWPSEGSALSYGLGWDTVNTSPFDSYGIKALTKGGDTLLYHGSLIVLPDENMAVAVLSSGGASTYDQIMGQNILLTALKAKGRISEIKPSLTFTPPKKTAITEDLKQYEGIYSSSGNIMKITMKDDGVLSVSSLVASSTQIYYYTGNGKFYYTDGSYYVTFEKNANGNVYLYHSGYVNMPGLGQTTSFGYLGEKLSDNQISSKLNKIWEKRSDKNYFLLTEKYSSETYAFSAPFAKLQMFDELKGYWMNAAIVDEDSAKSTLTIPDSSGRDLADYTFFQDGSTEYMKVNASVYVSSDYIKALPAANQKYRIDTKGYASWYSIDSKTASRKVSITVPKEAAYALYKEDGTCLAYSYIKKDKIVTLPKKGYLVLIGNAGSTFQVKFVK